ncbi:MAG: sugar phosphate isomerase/epimerase family protein, partial [Candidatus Latescibacterota bacterium]
PIDTALKHLAGLGFTGVEPTVLPGWSTELDTLDRAERRRIRNLFDEYDLEMPAVAGHCGLLDRDPAAHAENLRRLHGSLDLCAEWAGPAGPPALDTVLGGTPESWEADKEEALDRLGRLVDYATARGVTVALEPHVGSALDLPDKAVWLIERVSSPYLKLNFDVSHFEVLGIPTEESVAALAPHAAHTHVKDQRGLAPNFEFLIPGEGPFDFVAYLRAMERAGYTGYITAEVSIMVQRRPDYDPLAAAELTWQTLDRAFREAGIER